MSTDRVLFDAADDRVLHALVHPILLALQREGISRANVYIRGNILVVDVIEPMTGFDPRWWRFNRWCMSIGFRHLNSANGGDFWPVHTRHEFVRGISPAVDGTYLPMEKNVPDMEIEMGRTIARHLLCQPKFAATSREKLWQTCRHFVGLYGTIAGPTVFDWEEWSG